MIRHAVVSSSLAAMLAFGVQNAFAEVSSPKDVFEQLLPAEAQNKIAGIRIDDVVAVYPSLIPGLANVAANLKKKPEDFFPSAPVEAVHNVFLAKVPDLAAEQMELHLTAYVKYKGTSRFEKIIVRYNKGAKKLSEMSIQSVGSIDLKDMNFTLSVGLVDRKLILKDEAHDVKMIFPVGVGGFDEGVLNEGKVSLLTPRFKNGFLDQRAVISKRVKPRYFDGKPFVRILKGNDIKTDMTAIGFHIEINDSFVRGFDSHGCMRLRAFDLQALHDLIMDGDQQQLPITVAYRTEDPADHPAGKRNKTYKTVLNNGTTESPFFPLDRDNLVQMTYKESGAPVDKLIDHPADNNEDLFNYDTQKQLREQDERRKNECQAKVMAGIIPADEKSVENCLEEGKRKDSVKDRLYRKFMGIDSVEPQILF